MRAWEARASSSAPICSFTARSSACAATWIGKSARAHARRGPIAPRFIEPSLRAARWRSSGSLVRALRTRGEGSEGTLGDDSVSFRGNPRARDFTSSAHNLCRSAPRDCYIRVRGACSRRGFGSEPVGRRSRAASRRRASRQPRPRRASDAARALHEVAAARDRARHVPARSVRLRGVPGDPREPRREGRAHPGRHAQHLGSRPDPRARGRRRRRGVRPFFPRELALRVRALLRRTDGERPRAEPPLAHGPITLDTGRRSVLADGERGRADRDRVRAARAPAPPPVPRVHARGDPGPALARWTGPDPPRGRHPREGDSPEAGRGGLGASKAFTGSATGWRLCRRAKGKFACNSAGKRGFCAEIVTGMSYDLARGLGTVSRVHVFPSRPDPRGAFAVPRLLGYRAVPESRALLARLQPPRARPRRGSGAAAARAREVPRDLSTNLDEFFQVRVAGLLAQVDAGVTRPGADGRTPREQLRRDPPARCSSSCARRRACC